MAYSASGRITEEQFRISTLRRPVGTGCIIEVIDFFNVRKRTMAEEGKFKVTIDGISLDVAPGTTILNAARQIGGDIVPPAMCYYSKLEGSGGKCRTCLVKVCPVCKGCTATSHNGESRGTNQI